MIIVVDRFSARIINWAVCDALESETLFFKSAYSDSRLEKEDVDGGDDGEVIVVPASAESLFQPT